MKRFLWVFLVIMGLVLSGCATTDDLKRTRHDLDRKIAALQADTSNLQKELDEGRASDKSLRKNQADTNADMTALREQVQKLRGMAEDLRHDLDALRAERKEKDARLKDVALRIGFIENFIGVGKKSEPVNGLEKKDEKKANAAREAKNGKNGKEGKPDVYASAYKDFKDGKYEEARKGFQKYLGQHPAGTDLSDNAQFWIGECYYMEENYEQAILEYEKVIKSYPNADKVPQALLKQGLSFQKLGDKDSAKLLFQQVIKDYPDTNQAKIAKAKLKALKK